MRGGPFKVVATKSLSDHFSRCTKIVISNILLALLIVLIIAFFPSNAETDVVITTPNMDETTPKLKLTVSSTISSYWRSESYLTAVAVCVASAIWPFVMVLSLMLIWVKPLCPSTRTRAILFFMMTAKLSLLSAFTQAILTYGTYMDIEYEDLFEEQTMSSPLSPFGIYVAAVLSAIMVYQVFFIWDQMYCHEEENDGAKHPFVAFQDDAGSINTGRAEEQRVMLCSEYKALALEGRPRSCLGRACPGICSHCFLVIVVCPNRRRLIVAVLHIACVQYLGVGRVVVHRGDWH